MTKIIKDEEFYETYKPIKNPIDNNASFDGAMLETYGAELEHVLKVAREKPDHVWTVIDGDDGLCDYRVRGNGDASAGPQHAADPE